MNFLRHRPHPNHDDHATTPPNKPEPTAVERYLTGGGNPHNERAMALMMEVDRGNARRDAEERKRQQRHQTLNLPPQPEPTGNPVADAIAAAEHAELIRRAERAADEAERREKWAADDAAREEFLTYCRPATTAEYADWLRGYILNGGKVTHTRPDADLADFWTLIDKPPTVPTLYGAASLEVIVPARSAFTPRDLPRTFHGACGHSNFYFVDGHEQAGGYVPLFDDVKALLSR